MSNTLQLHACIIFSIFILTGQSAEAFNNCAATKDEEIVTKRLQLPEMQIPASLTTYKCQIFLLTEEESQMQLVGYKVITKHKELVHHLGLVSTSKEERQMVKQMKKPYICMYHNDSRFYLVTQVLSKPKTNLWTFCTPGDMGIDFQLTNRRAQVVVQVHWKNPQGLQGRRDAPGIEIYLSKKPRPFHGRMTVFDQRNIELPPGKQKIVLPFALPAKCTRYYFKQPRMISSIMMHMHQRSVGGSFSVWRNGVKVQDVTSRKDAESFLKTGTFALGGVFIPNKPVEFRPGDEIRFECLYSTENEQKTVKFSYGTDGEMCQFFVVHYSDVKTPNDDEANYLGSLVPCP